MYVVLDAGSCHMRSKVLGEELIRQAAGAGANSIKFQLFPDSYKYTDAGNQYLNFDLFKQFFHFGKKVGIDVTASVFEHHCLEQLLELKPAFIKFGYSARDDQAIPALCERGEKVVTSYKIMDNTFKHKNLVKLFVEHGQGEQYAVTHKLHFGGLFPRFDGFSDHTLGIGQTIEAAAAGAKWIEKHFRIEDDQVDCPDAKFAITPKEASEMILALRGNYGSDHWGRGKNRPEVPSGSELPERPI